MAVGSNSEACDYRVLFDYITRETPGVASDLSIDCVVTNPAIAGRALPSRNSRQVLAHGHHSRHADEWEHTRLACRFRRPRRNHLRVTPDSVSEALTDAREGACAPLRPLEIGRSSVRSETFAATRATKFPSPVGAA